MRRAGRAGKLIPMILFEGRFVQIEDSKAHFNSAKVENAHAWGVGRKEQYDFVKGAWKRR